MMNKNITKSPRNPASSRTNLRRAKIKKDPFIKWNFQRYVWGGSHTGHRWGVAGLAQQPRPPAHFHLAVSTSPHPLHCFYCSRLNKFSSFWQANAHTYTDTRTHTHARTASPSLSHTHTQRAARQRLDLSRLWPVWVKQSKSWTQMSSWL